MCRLSTKSESVVTQLCPTLCDHMDCRSSGSTVHGILQARIVEWIAISFSRGSSQPTQGLNAGLQHCRSILYLLSHKGGPVKRVVSPKEGFPAGSDGKESACNAGDLGFSPWVGKILWRRKWQLTPVFLPGEFHGQWSLMGYSPGVAKSWTL